MIISSSAIKQLRKSKGLSQENLSDKSGLSLRTIQRIENGETIPRGDSLNRIANAMDVSTGHFNKHEGNYQIQTNPIKLNSPFRKRYKIPIALVVAPIVFFILWQLMVYSVPITTNANGDVPLPADYDGDGIKEIAIYRPLNGYWYISTENQSWNDKEDNCIIRQFGEKGDIAVPADYNGDGKTQLAVWRPSKGMWVISEDNASYDAESHNYRQVDFGQMGDVPVPADFDGDKKTDIAIWRPSEGKWYILFENRDQSNSTIQIIQWGTMGDIPVPADFNGDGKTNIAVYRPDKNGTWYISLNNESMTPEYTDFLVIQWGVPNDFPMPIDTNGDGKKEVAIWRPSTGEWHINLNNDSYTSDDDKNRKVIQWGAWGDFLTPFDYDGDGKDELTVWRPSNGHFYISGKNRSWEDRGKTVIDIQWGMGAD